VLLLPVARVELLRSVGVEAADVGVAVPGADASSWRLQPTTSVSAAAIAAGRRRDRHGNVNETFGSLVVASTSAVFVVPAAVTATV
jgi:hypothetical protein